MKSDSELHELIAREAAGEIDAHGLARLDELCASDALAKSLRARLHLLLTVAASDDTTDAPGQTLHRAHQILRLHRESASIASTPATTSVLRMVFDSLRPTPGLRSTGLARRQIMLEADGVSADVFVERRATDHAVSVMLDGLDPDRVVLVTDESTRDMDRDPDGWRTSTPTGRAHLVIHAGDRTIASESFQIE